MLFTSPEIPLLIRTHIRPLFFPPGLFHTNICQRKLITGKREEKKKGAISKVRRIMKPEKSLSLEEEKSL